MKSERGISHLPFRSLQLEEQGHEARSLEVCSRHFFCLRSLDLCRASNSAMLGQSTGGSQPQVRVGAIGEEWSREEYTIFSGKQVEVTSCDDFGNSESRFAAPFFIVRHQLLKK